MPTTTPAPPARLAYRVAEAAQALGISRSQAYALIGSGQLPHVRIGNAIRVPVAALTDLIEGGR